MKLSRYFSFGQTSVDKQCVELSSSELYLDDMSFMITFLDLFKLLTLGIHKFVKFFVVLLFEFIFCLFGKLK